MLRIKTIEKIILKTLGNFSARNLYENNLTIFSPNYSQKKALNYLTVILHKLWKAKKIRKVTRGIFTNNLNFIEIDLEDWNSVINYYCKNNNGFVGKEFLWLQKGIKKDWPKKLLIYSNLTKSIKKKKNIEVRPTKIMINQENKAVFELYEMIQIAQLENENEKKVLFDHIKEHKITWEQISFYKSFFKRRFNKLLKLTKKEL